MTKLKLALIGVPTLILAAFLHYALPQVDVVRAIDTEIKRVDTTNPDNTQTTRDVRMISTQTLKGGPSVYRNEDNLFYFKFDSADLQARMQALSRDEAVIAVRHYGWRIRLLSRFPNALSVWEVEEGYRHIPVFNIIVLTLLAILGFAVHRRVRRISGRRAEARAERARRQAEEDARRSNPESDRRELDDFLNGGGSGGG